MTNKSNRSAVVWMNRKLADTHRPDGPSSLREVIARGLDESTAKKVQEFASRHLNEIDFFDGGFAVVPESSALDGKKPLLTPEEAKAAATGAPGSFDLVRFDVRDLYRPVPQRVAVENVDKSAATALAKLANRAADLLTTSYGVLPANAFPSEADRKLQEANRLEAVLRERPDVGPFKVRDAKTGLLVREFQGPGAAFRAALHVASGQGGEWVIRGPITDGTGRAVITLKDSRYLTLPETASHVLRTPWDSSIRASVCATGLTASMATELGAAVDELNRRDKEGTVVLAQVPDAMAAKFDELALDDDGAVYATPSQQLFDGVGARVFALWSAGSEEGVTALKTTSRVEESTVSSRPIRLSYGSSDYETLKAVYARDGEKIVFGVKGPREYNGPGVVRLAFKSRSAAEAAFLERYGKEPGVENIVEAPLGKFLTPLVLGTGTNATVMDPFHHSF